MYVQLHTRQAGAELAQAQFKLGLSKQLVQASNLPGVGLSRTYGPFVKPSDFVTENGYQFKRIIGDSSVERIYMESFG